MWTWTRYWMYAGNLKCKFVQQRTSHVEITNFVLQLCWMNIQLNIKNIDRSQFACYSPWSFEVRKSQRGESGKNMYKLRFIQSVFLLTQGCVYVKTGRLISFLSKVFFTYTIFNQWPGFNRDNFISVGRLVLFATIALIRGYNKVVKKTRNNNKTKSNCTEY